MTRLPGIVVLLCAPAALLAQGDKDLRAKADALFAKGEYAQAFEPYQTLVSNNVQDFDLNYRYGVCAMYGGADKDEAVKFLKRSTLAPTTPALAWYFLGKAYHLTYHFKDAIQAYDKFQGTADKRTLADYPVTALLLQCRNGQNLLSNLKEIDVHNKVEVDGTDFFRFYDLSSIGGKLVVTPDELLSSLDKKDKERGLVYLPDKGGPIYFSSHGKGNETGRDIYRTELMPDGSFAPPLKLAGFINTPQDESYPFMAPDGRTFYFCSKGHNSMGGYDVFHSTYDKGMDVFGAPVNMDFAVNTPDDDVLYLTDPEGKEACFASARDSKQGMLHVYRVSTNQAPVNITVLKGTFASQFDEKDRKAHIIVTDALSQEQVADVRTDIDGSYVLSLPRSGRYKFTVAAGPTGKTHVGMVEIPRNDEPKVYRQEMSLIDQGGEKLMIKNYFEQPLDEDMIALALEEIRRRAKLDVGSHPVVAETPVEEKRSGDVFTRAGFSGDMNRSTAQEMAESDATALQETERSLDTQAKTAFSMALENMARADAAARRAEELVTQANASTDEELKNKLMTDAARQRHAARSLSARARAAYQAGQDLEAERTATALKAQKAAKLKEDLNAAFAREDENATVIRLVELRARMDEKNAPDGALTAAEKMRRAATEREREAAVLLQRASDARSEEGELADRVARKKREEAEARGRKKDDLARERTELDGQLQAMREENDKAFTKARVAERAGIVARGQAELAKKLTVVAGTLPITEVSAEQRGQLAQRISGVEERMGSLAVDERFDAAIAEEVRETERSLFDWGASPADLDIVVSASAATVVRDPESDAHTKQGNTITAERADVPSGQLNKAAIPTEGGQDVPNAGGDHIDRSAQRAEEQPVASTPADTVSENKGIAGVQTSGRSTVDAAPNTATNNAVTGDPVPSVTGNNAATVTPTADSASASAQRNDSEQVSRTSGDLASAKGAATPGNDRTAQEEGALVNDGRMTTDRNANTEPAPEERAFVLSNELAELKQLRNAEKSRTKKDSLDQRIASIQQQLGATVVDPDVRTTGGATSTRSERSSNNAHEVEPAISKDADAARTAYTFTEETTEAIVLQHVFAGYSEKARTVLTSTADKASIAREAVALEQRLADSLDAESARQSAVLADHPERSGEVLARVERLRTIKERHLSEATRLMEDAGQRYGAGETQVIEDDAIASQQSGMERDVIDVRTSQTPHNDEYVLIEEDPEYVYTSSVTYRSEAARKETAQMDQHLDDLTSLETRIDSLEEVLLMMPEGRAKDKLRERTDRLIDDRMIARTEIGQASGYYTREEFRAAQDSAKRLSARTASIGLPLTEPTLQLAGEIESAAAREMTEAGKVRKRADRTEDIVLKDSLLRQAYAQELNAIRTMDRALTVRNYMLDARYKRGEQVAYEEIERRMFGEIGGPDVAASEEEERPTEASVPKDSTMAGLTRDPAGNVRYKEFMGQDSSTAEAISKELLGENHLSLDPIALQARSHELERASITAADQANRVQDSAAVAKRSDRVRLEEEAARLRLRSDSLHRAAQAADALASERAAASSEQERKDAMRKRLMRFYYLDEQEQEMVMNEADRSHYFEARSMAIDQREQAAATREQATTTKQLADVLLKQSADLLANAGSGQRLDTARSAQAQRLADQAVRLTHRSDSLNGNADRLMNAARVNEAQAASILQGLDPDRGTDIMAMEQRARRVEPVLAQVRAIDPAPASAATVSADRAVTQQPAKDTDAASVPTPLTVPVAGDTSAATIARAVASAGSSTPEAPGAVLAARVRPDLTSPLTADEFSLNVPAAERLKEIPMDAPLPAGVVFKVQVGAFRSEVPAAVFSDMTPVTGEHVGNGVKRYTVGMFTSAQSAAKATEQVRERGFRDAFVVAYQDGKRVPLSQAMKVAQPVAANAATLAETRPAVTARIEPVRTALPTDTNVAADQEVLTKYPATAEQLMAQFAPSTEATAYYNDPKAAPARQVETVKGLFFTVQVGVYSKPTALDKLFNITPLNSERTETGKIRYTTGVFVDMDKARSRKDETVGLGVKDAFITAYLNGKRVPMRDARALIARFGNSVLVDPSILTR